MDTLSWLFAHVCGQHHCWVMGGFVLPLCQRCTGLYVGGTFAICWIAALRPFPSSLVLWIHGLMMLIMAPFGYHLVAHGASVRMITGLLFGFGLTYYLALNPAIRVGAFEKRGNNVFYWAGLLLFIPLALLAVHSQASAIGVAIAAVALVGLATYVVLLILNLIVLPRAMWDIVKAMVMDRAR